MSLLDIENFYRNKSIFITGATGFLGKVLIEKLLRSCPFIEKIYILVRPKRGIDSSKRLDELFNSKKVKKFVSTLLECIKLKFKISKAFRKTKKI